MLPRFLGCCAGLLPALAPPILAAQAPEPNLPPQEYRELARDIFRELDAVVRT